MKRKRQAIDLPTVEKAIPIPKFGNQNKGSQLREFVRALKIGDSFVDFASRRATVRTYFREFGYTMLTRDAGDGKARFWRVNPPL